MPFYIAVMVFSVKCLQLRSFSLAVHTEMILIMPVLFQFPDMRHLNSKSLFLETIFRTYLGLNFSTSLSLFSPSLSFNCKRWEYSIFTGHRVSCICSTYMPSECPTALLPGLELQKLGASLQLCSNPCLLGLPPSKIALLSRNRYLSHEY